MRPVAKVNFRSASTSLESFFRETYEIESVASGSAHLLELNGQIPLTDDQAAKTQALLHDMRQAATPMTLARISPPGITPKYIDATWGVTDHVYPP